MEDTYQQNKIELHYWLKDNSHAMDALTLNRCEWELLHLFEEISKEVGYKISIEAEAISEGGIRQWFKIISKEENKKPTISKTILLSIITLVLSEPLKISFEMLKEYLLTDKEMVILEKEEKKLDNEGKRLDNEIKKETLKKMHDEDINKNKMLISLPSAEIRDIKANVNDLLLLANRQHDELEVVKSAVKGISDNTKITKRTSNFYEELCKEPKVCKISINTYGSDNKRLHLERVVDKPKFADFILSTNELETFVDEDASIEIISPVLNKGNYQWKGMYNGETINFNMRSNEFKTLVQTGKVEFKSGTYIKCILEMPRFINNLGEEIISSYNITEVIGFYNGISFNETDEGKKYIRKKEANKAQLDLFSNIND